MYGNNVRYASPSFTSGQRQGLESLGSFLKRLRDEQGPELCT